MHCLSYNCIISLLFSLSQTMANSSEVPVIQHPVICDRCDSNDVVNSYCLTCHGNLCDPCRQIHLQDKLLQRHRIVSRHHEAAERDRKSAPRPCKIHSDQEYVMCCRRCKIPCCPICLLETHIDHGISSFEASRENAKEDLTSKINEIETVVIPNIKAAASAIAKEKNKRRSKARAMKLAVSKRLSEIRCEIDRMGRDLISDIDRQYETDMLEIETENSKVKDKLKRAEDLVNETTHNMSLSSDISLITFNAEFPQTCDL